MSLDDALEEQPFGVGFILWYCFFTVPNEDVNRNVNTLADTMWIRIGLVTLLIVTNPAREDEVITENIELGQQFSGNPGWKGTAGIEN
jgi:hypothetical protein